MAAQGFGGGLAEAMRLRGADILACEIGLPMEEVAGDVYGLRLATPEVARWGMGVADMDVLAGRRDAQSVAPEVTAFRRGFRTLCFVRG